MLLPFHRVLQPATNCDVVMFSISFFLHNLLSKQHHYFHGLQHYFHGCFHDRFIISTWVNIGKTCNHKCLQIAVCIGVVTVVVTALLRWDIVGGLSVCSGISAVPSRTYNLTVWTEVWQFRRPVVHVTRLNKPSPTSACARARTHTHTHTHRIPLLGQSSTTAYRCLQAIRHPHAKLQKGELWRLL